MVNTSLTKLNTANDGQALALVEPLIERAPDIALLVAQQRPFKNADALAEAIKQELLALSEEGKIKLFNAHPELAPERPQAMTQESINEQGRLKLTSEVNDETARLKDLNKAYRQKFGFPFITAVAHHETRASILEECETRLQGDLQSEIENAITQVIKICKARVVKQFGEVTETGVTHEPG